MVTFSELYEMSEKEWKAYFKLFRTCDPEIFHKSITKDTWSPEKILRHLLGSLVMINNNALNTEKLECSLVMEYTTNPDDRVTLDQIEKEYNRINEVIHKGMAEITPELENENITFNTREIGRKGFLIMLFNHEQQHFGQVTWLLKRGTNWTHEELMNKMYGKPES